MAHFAQIDENNMVLRVIVVDNKDILKNGVEDEQTGINFCKNLLGGNWIQTSYNNNFRKQYCGYGFTYDPIKDIFIQPKPYPSWILDSNNNWQAPTERPKSSYTYTKTTAAKTWNIKHSLNSNYILINMDVSEEDSPISTTFVDLNNLTLTFSKPMSGSAIISSAPPYRWDEATLSWILQ